MEPRKICFPTRDDTSRTKQKFRSAIHRIQLRKYVGSEYKLFREPAPGGILISQ